MRPHSRSRSTRLTTPLRSGASSVSRLDWTSLNFAGGVAIGACNDILVLTAPRGSFVGLGHIFTRCLQRCEAKHPDLWGRKRGLRQRHGQAAGSPVLGLGTSDISVRIHIHCVHHRPCAHASCALLPVCIVCAPYVHRVRAIADHAPLCHHIGVINTVSGAAQVAERRRAFQASRPKDGSGNAGPAKRVVC